jgi:hypothetical protein
MEEFRELQEYPGYKIGNRGTILGHENYPLRPSLNNRDYYVFNVSIEGVVETILVHRVIGLAWIPNPENKPVIDHINRDTKDNRLENLRWATSRQNNENRGIQKNNKSGVIGLCFVNSSKLWLVQLTRDGVKCRKKFKERADAEEYLRLITGQH